MSVRVQNERIAAALSMANDTRQLRIGSGVVDETGEVFQALFGTATAHVVADTNTFKAAGERVIDVLRKAGIEVLSPFVFEAEGLHAHERHVEELETALGQTQAIAVAVGSGTINDMTKLASHRCGRPYMVVGTAASMDGYTAYGASVVTHGSKETFFCPAPRGVVADMEIIAQAPADMNAAGYGDLLAKIPAGADWILSDALGIEAVNPQGWNLVQEHLRAWSANPEGVRQGDFEAIQGLVEGLLMTGFAMQWCKSSRPASGADHQFSHLWDMQDHHFNGKIPFHGCKVAIGTLASTRLYEELFDQPIEELDVDAICAAWPSLQEILEDARATHSIADLREVALRECEAKYVTREQLAERLKQLKKSWPLLRQKLQSQLIPSEEVRQMLAAAGAPYEPEQIGISRERLRQSYIESQQIRRRYTGLDLARETGLFDKCLERLFAPGGRWAKA